MYRFEPKVRAASAGLCLALVLVASAGSAEAPVVDHAHKPHSIISILTDRVLPARTQIERMGTFGWLNYTSYTARVSFPAETARSLTCSSPVAFETLGDSLTAELEAGGFASLCRLAPGEYPYEVELAEASGTGRRLAGRLVVR